MVNRRSILNDPPKVLEGPQLLHGLIDFEAHADACALDFSSNGKRFRYSYRELQSCAQSLAYLLGEALKACRATTDPSPPHQHLVPILLPQSPALYIAQLAILESGGAFCPIYLDAPKERVKFVVGDVEADLIITTPEFEDVTSWENGPRVIVIDDFPAIPAEECSSCVSSREPQPLDLAYVMYTSGSSGTPKGVAVNHLAASQSLLAHERHIPSFERFLQFAAPSFDVSVFEIFFPLKRGSTLVGCDRSQLLDNLPGMINELEVDAAELTPTVVGSLLQTRTNAPCLKLLLTIGEMLTRPIVEEFGGSETKESMLYGMYGPTEAAIHCTINPRMSASSSFSNIGVPLDTVSTFIAAASTSNSDESVDILAIGELGELVLGGPQLADGYLNREEQNKAAFIRSKGKNYYRTGDKARLLEDGTIEILGRMSAGQVKLRGQRIELGEIEEAVYKHVGIKTTSAVVIGSVLVVFALVNDQSLGPVDILATCSKWLPKFMIPNEIIVHEQFPYLPSGKVDKRKLEADYQKQRAEDAKDGKFSATAAEAVVEETIRDLLGSFSTTMRLAAAGLDSLVAIRVAGQLRQSGYNVTTIAVLQAETPRALAKLCENASSKEDPQQSNSTPKPRIESQPGSCCGHLENVEYTLHCTPLQSAMLSETAVNKMAYRNWIELELSGINDEDQIISALHDLAQHHPILRTGFMETEKAQGYVQVVWMAFNSSKIENVREFAYDFDPSKDASLRHPLRIQIRYLSASTRLLIHIHHALYDAWSLELLLDDLDALLMHKEPKQRPAFASIVEGYLDGTIGSDSRGSQDYWKDHLADLDLRRLPNFNTRKVSSSNLAVANFQTSIPTSEVEAAARRFSSSPQSLLQAAYALILTSYLGTSDVCFGTVFSGRTLSIARIEDIAGPCLSTLPIRVDISTSATLQELVQDLNSTNRKHLEHSTVPLRDIKTASGVHPRQPLFDTLLVWQQTLHNYDQKRNHVAVVDSIDNLEFSLTLEIFPNLGDIVLKASYREDLLPRSQVDILLRQVEQVSRLIVERSTTPLEDVFSHLSNDILSLENENPQQSSLGVETLSSSVERIAVEDPDRPAIDFATSIEGENVQIQRLSYLELNSRSNQIGQRLLLEDVLPDELVCICIDKSVDLYTSILSAVKVGAGYLPVTTDIPLERLRHILHEAKVRLVVAHSSSRPILKACTGPKIIYVDEIDMAALSSENIPSRSYSENLAYSVFTSGSTGTPKGVLVTQGNLLSNLDVLQEIYPATKNSRLLQSCSQAFDVSVFEIYFTWKIGACICSATKDVLFQDIEKAIRLLHVTHLSLTPTVAALVDPNNVPGVEFLVTAGEAVTQKVFNTWAGKGLYQGYGPSETTNICTIKSRVTSDDFINNIGPPLKNTSAFVLSPGPRFDLLPRGAEGEFCFGGSQVFRGYVDRNQEVGMIVNHPTFGRLYRSGDFGRLMPDGCLAFTGRKDDQVKVRGQRIELGEINAIILQSPDVYDCVTMVVDGTSVGSQRLVAFWTASCQPSDSFQSIPPDQAIISRLYSNLESSIPVYMMPSALIPLSSIPLTSQGKIDKRALTNLYKTLDLKYLESATRVSRNSSEHKWSDLELVIANALSMLTDFPLDDINPDTSFFGLGIDSISAIAFSRTLRQATNLPIEISDILKYSSALRLAERLSGLVKSQVESAELDTNFDFGLEKDLIDSTVERYDREGKKVQSILPCTPLQEAMLSAGESSDEKVYANQVVFEVRGDLEKLQKCWQQIVQRHEILRTCFFATDMPCYPYVQIVLKEFNLRFGTIEHLDDLQPTTGEFEPPYSFDLMELSGPTKLVISMHHALYDGVALSVLYEEVEKLYHADALPFAPSFLPFIHKITTMNKDSMDQFWGNKLKNIIPSKFPVIQEYVPNTPNRSTIQRLHAKSALRWIEESTRRHNTTLLAACHAIWASLISEQLKTEDVCFGNVVSGRTAPIEGIERLVAPCFNTIPFRLQNVHKLSYLEAFRTLQAFNADALPFQLTPLRRIQSKFSPNGARLFDTLFILQQPSRDLDPSIWSILEDNGAMDFPLVCEIVPKTSEDSLEIIVHSHTSIITPEDAHGLLDDFINKLQIALENPRHQLLSPAVKEQIISKKIENEHNMVESTSELAMSEMTPDELSLRDIFADFANVNVKKIDRDVSIFRLGLDSISAVQIAVRLKKLGHNVKGSDVLENSTIAKLSSYISTSKGTLANDSPEYDFAKFDSENRTSICLRSNISSSEIEAIRPCTAVQQGMIAQSIHSEGEEYVNSMLLELPPNSSLSAFKEAWKVACRENEMLRTGFSATINSVHPFAMIIYTKDNFELPWSEPANDSTSKSSMVLQLSRPPWSLVVEKDGYRTLVKFTAHHALYDAQSIQMILSDVANAYNCRQISSRPPITPLLGSILNDMGMDNSAKKHFWETKENKIIANRFPELTPLRVLSSAIKVHEISSRTSIAELERCCKNNGVTMQAAGQAAWARLLSAYIGETSTTFGMTLSGRSVHEKADTISFPSIVTLPVRCDVTGTNEELLSRTMNSNILLHKHQFTPLTNIQKWAGYPEGRIFDTLFAYQKIPDNEPDLKYPWKVVREDASVDYSVSLEVQPTSSGEVTLRLTFKDDIIPVEHADLLLRQYDTLLQDTLRNPLHPCDIFPDAEIDLLSITPAKERELPSPVILLHEFVERGAEEWPDKTALEFTSQLGQTTNRRSWTYNELEKAANKVSQLLIKRGVSQGQVIAICFDKCAEASFAIIGILKAGCAYVALDPQAPVDRLKFIIEDSGADLVLSAGETAKQVQSWMRNAVIALDSPTVIEDCPSEKPTLHHSIQPTDNSYCLYTSGTTGTPKGCLISHENAVQAMLSFQRLFAGHWEANSKWLQFASFHFDVSVLEQFWSWSVGICVSSAPRDLIFEDIPNAIRQLGITHIDLTPSLARLLQPDETPSLCKGVFITGGEQLKQEILDAWGDYACIYNGYGPTEATIGVTMYPRVPKNGKPANIGPQFENVGSFVLKPGTALPVLRGGVGELCVSGKLVGKGYLNRPDLTNERFPTLEKFDVRVYRTGDLVRILHDRSFLFLGRADDQVKLRGQRLELNEINEVVKKATDSVQEVVTLVLKHNAQQKEQLVTFFVSAQRESVDIGSMISTMRYACRARLPGYMVPTHFLLIKALPLNANNKADAKQLAASYNQLSVADLQKLSSSSQQEVQWTNAEKKILEILVTALHVDITTLTRDSTIFQLGLDSISIIEFSRSLQVFGLSNATLSVIRSNPAVGSLIQALLNNDNSGQEGGNDHIASIQNISAFSQKHMIRILQELGIERTEIESIAPCTPVQEGMIYRFLESDQSLYFNTFEFNLDNKTEVEKLLVAWQKLISNLQILRTQFVATDDGYAQVVLRTLDIDWERPIADFNSMEKSSALKTPFNLHLILGTERRMLLRVFHGLYDGNSLVILLQRLVEEYRNPGAVGYGPPFHSSLPHGPLGRALGAQEFWSNHLQSWHDTKFPIKPLKVEKDIAATLVIPSLDDLEKFRKHIGTTHQSIIQAAWISVLQTISSPDLTIGMVISGRAIDFEGADEVIGPLFNTVPFHSKIELGMTMVSLISICHDFSMKMQDFQHTPLKDIQKWNPVKPGQSLFDTLFVFQRPETNIEGLASGIWVRVDDESVADYPLAFEATLNIDGSLTMTIVAQGSVFETSEVQTLLYQMKRTLLATLEEDGQNIILESGGYSQSSKTTHVPEVESIAEQSSKLRNPTFRWTKEAQQMRAEVAFLANIDEADIHENSSMFELGLDSIDVIKLSSRLKRHDIIVPVSTIIKCQSIANTVSSIHLNGLGYNTVNPPSSYVTKLGEDLSEYLGNQGLVPNNFETILPATPLQHTMVNEMLQSNFSRYFTLEVFALSHKTDTSRLIAAVQNVIDKSPILRTCFIEVDDPKSPVSYAQVIIKNHEPVIESVEISLDTFLASFKAKSVDIAVSIGTLFHVQVITIGEKNYMIWALSHALYDGTSLRLLHRDIEQAYHGNLTARPDYLSFVEHVFTSTTEEARGYWRNALSNLPRAAFPNNTTEQLSDSPMVHRLELRSRVTLESIENLCKSSKVTIQVLGQTCWAILLAHLMEQLDVVFGSVLSCRDSEEANEIMFPLMNTVAVRSILHGALVDMLLYMQDMSDTTRQFQHFPLGTAHALALSSRDSSFREDTTFFDTLFIYQGRRQEAQGKPLYESVHGVSDVEFPVCVEMEIVDSQLVWTVACKSTARDTIEAENMIERLDNILRHIVAAPQAPTVVSDSEGVSICGLPKFKIQDSSMNSAPRSLSTSNGEQWTHTERVIRKALHEVSSVPEDMIHKDSTIFQLGLDSIVILKIPALLRIHGVNLSVSNILRGQTISFMAKSALRQESNQTPYMNIDAVISHIASTLDPSTAHDLERQIGDIQSVWPTTAGQLYMIRMWQTSQGVLFYPSFTYVPDSSMDKTRLEKAWAALLNHHDILRTGFVETESGLLQIVFRNLASKAVHYLTGSQQMNPKSHHGNSNFDLRHPPLSLVVEESAGSALKLKLIIHHALYDGISLPILMHQLQLLYQGHSLPPAMSFKTFIGQSISAQGRISEAPESPNLVKWASYLSQATQHFQSVNNSSNALDVHSERRTEVFHPRKEISPPKQVAQDIGVSVDALLLASISKVYARFLFEPEATSTKDVVFGIYFANRAPFGEDLSTLAAPTLNILPLFVRDPIARRIRDIAVDIQKDLRMISSEGMSCASLESIYEWTGVCVNFVVNILKDASSDVEAHDKSLFKPVQDMARKAEVVDYAPNQTMARMGEKGDAYLPSIDVEIRYQGNMIDIGVFAPTVMLSVNEAEFIAERFIELLT